MGCSGGTWGVAVRGASLCQTQFLRVKPCGRWVWERIVCVPVSDTIHYNSKVDAGIVTLSLCQIQFSTI